MPLPATFLLSHASCDYALASALADLSSAESPLLPEISKIPSNNPALADQLVSCSVPRLEISQNQARLLWEDTTQEPATQDLLEIAGFYALVQSNYPDLSLQPRLKTTSDSIDLADAILLWKSLRNHWQTLADRQLNPSWFGQDNLHRCGWCSTCRTQMKQVQDVGLLENVGMKNRTALWQDLGVKTIPELARIPGAVPEEWQRAVGEAAQREGIDRPEVALLQESQWDAEQAARDIQELADKRTAQLLSEDEDLLPVDLEEPSQAETRLIQYVEGLAGQLSPTDQAIAMIASATGYHRRERTQFWTDHFARVFRPVHEWDLGRGVGIIQDIQPLEDWAGDPERPRVLPSRVLEVWLKTGESFSLKKGDKGLCLYYGQWSLPTHLEKVAGGLALDFRERNEKNPATINTPNFRAEVLEVETVKNQVRVRLRESLGREADQYPDLPLALGPAMPLQTKAQEAALLKLAEATGETLPDLPVCAAADLAARRPPRLKQDALLADPADFSGQSPLAQALVASLEQLDSSYLAVQGPPGAGKTFVGSRVLGDLVKKGWKIGVVSQSHAVIENMLAGCVNKGGVPAEQVAKFKGKTQSKTPSWGETAEKDLSEKLAGAEGFIIGGTAWDFASEKKFAPESLDLLVVDEAGQYSLANTFAVARAARNLLLLGDPQQLPQVTQGKHEHYVDESALGWLIGDKAVLPAELGYFMDQTWRMHPALCKPVSQLSYAGALTAAPAASTRQLAGRAPGLYVQRVNHAFNSSSSLEEAKAVVAAVEDFIGSTWSEDGSERALEASDILVVAAYNAQVDTINQALEDAGFREGRTVKVGTVDKFQGQEAPVVIISMAASSPATSEQVADFLLSPNRLNVAISRGQWCALLLVSPQFTHYLPRSSEELARLSSFVRLINEAEIYKV